MTSNDDTFVPQRILVGISSAPDAAAGLRLADADARSAAQATWLAEQTGAELRLMHVVDFLDRDLAEESVQPVIAQALGGAMEQLCEAAKARGVVASHVLGSGKAWYQLLAEAHRWGADLLAISPRREHLSFGQRIVHGSTARRVLRKASCPVWVVDPEREVGLRRILALVDGSPVSSRVMSSAAALANASGAELLALRCLDYPQDIALRRLPDAQRALRSYHDEVRDDARREVERLAAEVGGDWTVLLHDDWVARVVPDIVAEREIDVVVLGCLSAGGVIGVLLGSTAEQVLERTAVSAWIVRPEGWRSPVEFS